MKPNELLWNTIKHRIVEVETSLLYSNDPKNINPPEVMRNVVFRKLSNSELSKLAMDHDDAKRHCRRYLRLEQNDAYAVFYDGNLAHIAWLKTSEYDNNSSESAIVLKQNEAEITQCVTIPMFRRKGLYEYAIRGICQGACGRGIKRVFMAAEIKNIGSQRGIESAGLVKVGRMLRLTLMSLPKQPSFTIRIGKFR